MKITNILSRNNIFIFRIAVAIALLLPAFADISAQELLKGKKETSAVKTISSGYKPWRAAGWSARVRSDILPVSVTMKTYMLRDSLTLISLRAPLMGEVGRIEIDSQTILIVNKMKKRYARIELSSYGELPRTVHSNIQDILIGRVAIIGEGTLSASNCDDADIYSMKGEGYLVACALPKEYSGINYGYAVDEAGQIVTMMATKGKTHAAEAPEGMESAVETLSLQATADVSRKGNSASAVVTALTHGKEISVSLEGINLEWGPSGFDRLNLTRGYTECSVKQALSF